MHSRPVSLTIDPMKKLLLLLLLLHSIVLNAEEQVQHPTLLGSWEGPLTISRDEMTLAFTFAMSDGTYTAALISSGLAIYGMPVESVEIKEKELILRIRKLDLEFIGNLRWNEAGDRIIRIDGDLFQGSEMVPVVLLPVDSPSY